MIGFDRWLESQKRIPYIGNANNALAMLCKYRTTLRTIQPRYGADLAAMRKRRQRPAGRIVVTDDFDVADSLMALSGADYPLLIDRYAAYDFSTVYAMPVLYLMPNEFWALDVMHQIAECEPAKFSLIWPCEENEVQLWS